ncbi:MAG: hypothetical protein ACE5KH_00750 [Candidatus Geothermarchaeales archaeon]
MSERVLHYLEQSGENHPGPLALTIIENLPPGVILGRTSPTVLATAHYVARLLEGAPISQEEAASLYGVSQHTVYQCLRAAKVKSPQLQDALKLGRRHRALIKEIRSLEERLRHWRRQNREAERRIPELRDRIQRLHRQREKLVAASPFK